jgi:hypothetical protein
LPSSVPRQPKISRDLEKLKPFNTTERILNYPNDNTTNPTSWVILQVSARAQDMRSPANTAIGA